MSALQPCEQIVRDATLRAVRHLLGEPELPVYRDLKGMCERVSDSYRDRVVLELLQNAHDAHDEGADDGRIALILDADDGPFGALIVANRGNAFTRDNFEALCRPSRTTKTVNEAIGNKGVGFLSAFQVCAHPEIYSRATAGQASAFDGFCFQFADDQNLAALLEENALSYAQETVVDNMPRLYLACPLREQPKAIKDLASSGFVTAVRLRLKNAEAHEAVARQLSALVEGTAPVQLFLTRISKLHVSAPHLKEGGVLLTRQSRPIDQQGGFSLHEVACNEQRFVVARLAIAESDVKAVIARDVTAERLPPSWLDWAGDAMVSLAVAGEGDPLNGRLYNFLPMGTDAMAPFAGHLDAPFYASIDRLKLQSSVELNAYLLARCQALAVMGAVSVVQKLPRESARGRP